MEVRFRTKKLQKCYEDSRFGCRAWGEKVAGKFIQRIDIMQDASDMEVIRRLPGLDCHPLKGRREGQYAVTLHDRWRLVFTLEGQSANVISVEEVSKHYGD